MPEGPTGAAAFSGSDTVDPRRCSSIGAAALARGQGRLNAYAPTTVTTTAITPTTIRLGNRRGYAEHCSDDGHDTCRGARMNDGSPCTLRREAHTANNMSARRRSTPGSRSRGHG